MIRKVNREDIPECVRVIRHSHQTVADEFGFTKENAPGYVAFATDENRLKWHMDQEHRLMFLDDENGVIRPNGYFPDMKALGDYLHSHGLKFGIYSSPGPRTCNRYEGTYGHDALDAATWASWGVDYVKYDWCYYREIFARETAGRKPTDEDRIKPFRKLYGELLRQPRANTGIRIRASGPIPTC